MIKFILYYRKTISSQVILKKGGGSLKLVLYKSCLKTKDADFESAKFSYDGKIYLENNFIYVIYHCSQFALIDISLHWIQSL